MKNRMPKAGQAKERGGSAKVIQFPIKRRLWYTDIYMESFFKWHLEKYQDAENRYKIAYFIANLDEPPEYGVVCPFQQKQNRN